MNIKTLKIMAAAALTLGAAVFAAAPASAMPMSSGVTKSVETTGATVDQVRLVCDWRGCYNVRPRYYARPRYFAPRRYGYGPRRGYGYGPRRFY